MKDVDRINEEIKDMEARETVAREKYKSAERSLMHFINKRKSLEEQRDKITISKGNLSWDYILEFNHSTTKARYELMTSKLLELGLFSGGFHDETNQVVVQMHFHEESPIKMLKEVRKKLDGLITILPYIKPVSLYKGKKLKRIVVFPIEGESVNMLIEENNDFAFTIRINYFEYLKFKPLHFDNFVDELSQVKYL